jgi:cell division protein FtsB
MEQTDKQTTEKEAEDKKVEMEISVKQTPWWKKLLLPFIALFSVVAIIFGIKNSQKSIDKLDKEIKEKKAETKELKKQAEVVKEEIEQLQEERIVTEEKVNEKVEEFNKFVETTAEEAKIFDEKKEELKKDANNTQANADWVKQRFGGNVKIK